MLFPIVTESRVLIDLSGIWNFKIDDGNGFDEKWFEKPLQNSMTMPVPCAYNDMKENKDLRDHYGWVFYQKEFTVPKLLSSQRIVLRIGAATHKAVVYLNGEKLAEHKGGFLPFEVELKNLKEANLLTLAVDNRIDHSTLPMGSENFGAMMMIGGKMSTKEVGKRQNKPNFI